MIECTVRHSCPDAGFVPPFSPFEIRNVVWQNSLLQEQLIAPTFAQRCLQLIKLMVHATLFAQFPVKHPQMTYEVTRTSCVVQLVLDRCQQVSYPLLIHHAREASVGPSRRCKHGQLGDGSRARAAGNDPRRAASLPRGFAHVLRPLTAKAFSQVSSDKRR